MDYELWIALGTFAGTFAGILTSAKLSTYRIGQLEKKVDKHNSMIERTYKLENDVQAMKDDINEIKEELREKR